MAANYSFIISIVYKHTAVIIPVYYPYQWLSCVLTVLAGSHIFLSVYKWTNWLFELPLQPSGWWHECMTDWFTPSSDVCCVKIYYQCPFWLLWNSPIVHSPTIWAITYTIQYSTYRTKYRQHNFTVVVLHLMIHIASIPV